MLVDEVMLQDKLTKISSLAMIGLRRVNCSQFHQHFMFIFLLTKINSTAFTRADLTVFFNAFDIYECKICSYNVGEIDTSIAISFGTAGVFTDRPWHSPRRSPFHISPFFSLQLFSLSLYFVISWINNLMRVLASIINTFKIFTAVSFTY